LSDPFPPPETLDAPRREQLAAALPGPLWEKLNGSLQRDQQRLTLTEERLRFAEYKVRVLEERLRLIRINKYGPGSEALSDAQRELLEAEPGVSVTEGAAEGQREPVALPPSAKSARPPPGRQQLPAHRPRVERLIACPPEQCICGPCGRPTPFIGYEQSEPLDVEPAKYVVVVTKREKRACQSCEEQGVTCAPLPVRIISERFGQRSGGHRRGGEQIRRPPCATSSGRRDVPRPLRNCTTDEGRRGPSGSADRSGSQIAFGGGGQKPRS
jgi:Transposase C of IS166 homeodomain/zinc-finger binding domain of transposase IS66